MRPLHRRLLPAALAFVACSSSSEKDAGPGADAGNCPHPPTGDAGTVRCSCEVQYFNDGDAGWFECCDEDIGNPCPICCFNPRDADGGRQYYPDGGTAICYC